MSSRGGERRGVFGEAGTRSDQVVELSAIAERVEPSQCGNNVLLDLAVNTFVVHDLKIFMAPRLLDSREHGQPPCVDTTEITI